MPVFRYFVFIGGALLALLLLTSATLPTPPAVGLLVSGGDLPAIRIHSERKWPARVVIDTTQPTISAPQIVTAEAVASPPPAPAAMSAKARVRESFAQFVSEPRSAGAASKKADVRAQQPVKRKVARARLPGQPMMLVAQQPHYGLFNTMW